MIQRKMEEAFSPSGIFRHLPNGFDKKRVHFYNVIDSTNNEAKRFAAEGAPDGTVFLANCQTAGRGRVGRSFYSPEDGGIYFSCLLRPQLSADDVVLITVAASVAAADAIFAVTGVYPAIKWVNDLFLGRRKVCGILTEMVSGTSPAVVVGVGINCSAVFPEELQEIAGNLPKTEDLRNRLAAELICKMPYLEEIIKEGNFLDQYRAHSMVIGQIVTLPQEPGSRYFAKGIGDSGELILEDETGTERRLTTGEISIRLADTD
ncbi:MAG: biotin--[acetyl-CoA-carboxylase] ligase [Clostridia bacterium]|nr:biotin--[acetyl-CoA-carboxylase] ligase [Clostridia bacterium]